MLFQSEAGRVKSLLRRAGRGMDETQFFAAEILAWKNSPQRREHLDGERYYRGEHDIVRRRRTVIGDNGELTPVENLPNNRIVDNRFGLLVDQKANYLLGKPFTLSVPDGEPGVLGEVFNRDFQRLLRCLAMDALRGGLGWLFVSCGSDGMPVFRRFPAYEILPFWADDAHTVLDAAARLYTQEVWDGRRKTLVERVELYRRDGLYRYVLAGGELIPDVEGPGRESYLRLRGEEGETELCWEKIPLIAFRYNPGEIPLLRRVRSLQDSLNLMESDFANAMQEDPRNTILVLENYDGENLGEFRRNLAAYGAVKVRSGDGARGGVSTLSVQVSAENYRTVLELLRRAIADNAHGFDARDERLSNNPNQMNIQSMYAGVDLDANGMETEFQAGLQGLLWFVRRICAAAGRHVPRGEVRFVFNRDILINESEAIDGCVKSAGLLSRETVVEQHPWVDDPGTELRRLEKQEKGGEAEHGGMAENGAGRGA